MNTFTALSTSTITVRHPDGSIRLRVPTEVPLEDLMPDFLEVIEQPDSDGWLLSAAPQTHLTGHSEGENALLDATVDVRGAVYGFALNVVAGQELERGRGGVSQT